MATAPVLVQKVVLAPVVSADSNSPEAKMARDAKRLEAQTSTDAKFDTVLDRTGARMPADGNTFQENFCNAYDIATNRTAILIGISAILLATILMKKRR